MSLAHFFRKRSRKKVLCFMKPITEVWLEKAREDLDVALEIISREHLSGMVAFHSQQAVEKTLKGVI